MRSECATKKSTGSSSGELSRSRTGRSSDSKIGGSSSGSDTICSEILNDTTRLNRPRRHRASVSTTPIPGGVPKDIPASAKRVRCGFYLSDSPSFATLACCLSPAARSTEACLHLSLHATKQTTGASEGYSRNLLGRTSSNFRIACTITTQQLP